MKQSKVMEYLERYGWVYKEVDAQTFLSEFNDKQGNKFKLWIKAFDEWLTLTVIDYVSLPAKTIKGEMYEYLLVLNANSYISRFALDESRKVIVTADILTSKGLTYDEFILALEAVVHTSVENFSEINKLATRSKK